MPTVIKLKRSESAGDAPVSGDLEVGEVCMNISDQKIYTKKSDNSIVVMSEPSTASTQSFGIALDGLLVKCPDGTRGGIVVDGLLTKASQNDAVGKISKLLDDTSPTLGGNLDLNSKTVSNGTLASTVTATTQSAGDNSTKLATTAYADAAGTGISELLDDTTPQLGGNLDVLARSITTSTTNGNIAITPHGSGRVVLDGISFPNADGSNGQVLQTNGSGVLSFASVTTDPTMGGDLSGTASNAQLVADCVDSEHIAADSIDSEHYAAGSVDQTAIGDSQVSTNKIVTGAVVTAKIADDAVTADKLASNSVVSASIVDGTIVNADISNTTITGGKLVNGTITATQLAANVITDAEVADNALSGNKIHGGIISSFASTGIDDNANATAITIDANEKVGIGTTSPSGKIQIKEGPTEANICTSYKGHYFASQSDANTDGFEIYQQHGSNTNRNSFVVNDNRTGSKSSAFLVRNDGKVGIGTASPADLLEITGGGIRLTRPQGITWNGTNEKIYTSDGTDGTAGSIICKTGGTVRMHINASSGSVGIGTTTPNSYEAEASQLVIGTTSGNNGMTIASGGDNVGSIYFADGTSGNKKYRGYITYTHTGPEKLQFGCAADTRMTINSSGQVGIGIVPTTFLHAEKWLDSKYVAEFKNLGSTNPHGLSLKFNHGSLVDGHNTKYINCVDASATRMIVYGDGDIQNHDNSYGGTSDEKLKQDITDSSSQWDDVKALSKIVRKFRFKTDVEDDPNASFRLGLVAQEVETISPALVKDNPDTEEVEVPSVDDDGNPVVDEEGNPVMETIHQETGTITKSVKYSIAYMKAFKALGEALERIEVLEQEVEKLKG